MLGRLTWNILLPTFLVLFKSRDGSINQLCYRRVVPKLSNILGMDHGPNFFRPLSVVGSGGVVFGRGKGLRPEDQPGRWTCLLVLGIGAEMQITC